MMSSSNLHNEFQRAFLSNSKPFILCWFSCTADTKQDAQWVSWHHILELTFLKWVDVTCWCLLSLPLSLQTTSAMQRKNNVAISVETAGEDLKGVDVGGSMSVVGVVGDTEMSSCWDRQGQMRAAGAHSWESSQGQRVYQWTPQPCSDPSWPEHNPTDANSYLLPIKEQCFNLSSRSVI